MTQQETKTSAQNDLETSARAAGAAGLSYNDWASDDATYELVMRLDAETDRKNAPSRGELQSWEAAFREGRRESRAATWVSIWTTASEDYDQFGTETAEGPFPWEGKQLRRVLVDPSYDAHQCARYGSGSGGAWEEDPRVTDARIAERIANERFECELHAARRAGGLLWIREVDASFLFGDDDAADEEARQHGIGWSDVRAERTRRNEEKAAAERAVVWKRCRASFADGVTLIDEGTKGSYSSFGNGWIPGQPKRAWRDCKVKPHYDLRNAGDADKAEVVGEGNEVVGSLELVAEHLSTGRYRLARPDEHVPPLAVVKRFGREPFDAIFRVEVEGATVWVGRPTFGEVMVLDDAGKVARKKKLVERAMCAWREKMFGGAK